MNGRIEERRRRRRRFPSSHARTARLSADNQIATPEKTIRHLRRRQDSFRARTLKRRAGCWEGFPLPRTDTVTGPDYLARGLVIKGRSDISRSSMRPPHFCNQKQLLVDVRTFVGTAFALEEFFSHEIRQHLLPLALVGGPGN